MHLQAFVPGLGVTKHLSRGPVAKSDAWISITKTVALALLLLACPTLVFSLAGCAAPQKAARLAAAVYPPAPDSPRVALLASYSSGRDVVRCSEFDHFFAGESDKYEEAKADEGQKILKAGGVALHAGRLLVSDLEAQVVHVFDLRQRSYERFQPQGRGMLIAPESLATSPTGRLYVGDLDRGVVVVFNAKGEFETLLGEVMGRDAMRLRGKGKSDSETRALWESPPFCCSSLAVSRRHLFVADSWRHEITVFDAEGKQEDWSFGGPEPTPEAFFPAGLACDPTGGVWVSELFDGRILRFNARGKLLQTFGRRGDGPGEFRRPRGIACDRKGRVYVADEGQHVVHVFDAEGRSLMVFGGPSGDWGGLVGPVDVAIDYEHVDVFADLAPKGRSLEHLVLVTSQTPGAKVAVFGFLRAGEDESHEGVTTLAASSRETGALKPSTRKTPTRAAPSLDNLERRVIVCARGSVYLGSMRSAVPIADQPLLEQQLRQFVRYFDPRREVLKWSTLRGAGAVQKLAAQAVADARELWGEGLRSVRAVRPHRSQGRVLEVDEDGDGKPEVYYAVEAGRRLEWTRKFVDAVPRRPGLEEAYDHYDPHSRRWRLKDVDTNGDGLYDLRLLDTDPSDGDWEVALVSPFDAKGQPFEVMSRARLGLFTREPTPLREPSGPRSWIRYEDTNGDGLFDEKRVNSNPVPTHWGRAYTDFHPASRRWLRCSVDTHGDGRFNLSWRDLDPTNETWEELWERDTGRGAWRQLSFPVGR